MDKTTIKRWVDNPWSIFKSMGRRGWLDPLSDRMYLSIMYRARFNKKIDWKTPTTFNEKLQWLKLYDRKPIYSQMVDKYEAKRYVADRVGEEYVVPVLGGPWNSFDEIDFNQLPDQFVLKTTHDCGGVVICHDKKTFDRSKARDFLNNHLRRNYYLHCREWPYKDVKPRIFAEKNLLERPEDDLKDYKFFCFNGVGKLLFVASDRQSQDQETKFDFYDMDFHHLPIINGHPNSEITIERPECFDQMVDVAERLSEGIPHLRVDLYEVGGRIYVGELTFAHWGGFVPFEPAEWDITMGSWIRLPD